VLGETEVDDNKVERLNGGNKDMSSKKQKVKGFGEWKRTGK